MFYIKFTNLLKYISFLIAISIIFFSSLNAYSLNLGTKIVKTKKYTSGEIIKLKDSKSNPFEVKFELNFKRRVVKGVNTSTGKAVVLKRINDEEEARYKRYIEKFLSLDKKYIKSKYLDQLVKVEFCAGVSSDDEKYILMPFVKGKRFDEHFKFKTTKDGSLKIGKKSKFLIEKIIRIAEIYKNLLEIGIENQDIWKKNIIIGSDSKVHLIDLDHMEPFSFQIDKIEDTLITIRSLITNQFDYTEYISHYPFIDYPYVKMAKNKEVNDSINHMIKLIDMKIADGSYFQDKRIYNKTEQSLSLICNAIDGFISDLNKILNAVVYSDAITFPEEDIKLSEEKIKEYYSDFKDSKSNLKYLKLGGKNIPGKVKPILTLIRVPIVISNYEDIIFMSKNFEGKLLSQIRSFKKSIYSGIWHTFRDFNKNKKDLRFFYDSKKVVLIIYENQKLDSKKERDTLIEFLKSSLFINKKFKFVKI